MHDSKPVLKKRLDFILNSFWLGACMVLGAVFIYNNIVFLAALANHSDRLLLEGPYDWPDTAVFTDLIRTGYWTNPNPQFISGGQVWGLFPPLFMLVAIPFDMVIQNLSYTFLILAFLIQIPVFYYTMRDWPHKTQKIFILLILGWSAITWHQFPLVMRLREQLAVLFMVLMYKNVFKLSPIINHFVFSSLMILSQPTVAIIGGLLYPFIEAEGRIEKIDRRYLVSLVALCLIFIGVYSEHIALKGQNMAPLNAIGFAHFVVDIAAPNYLPFLLMQLLIISVFFVRFDRKIFVWIWVAYIIGMAALIMLTYMPSLFMRVVGPFSEDFNPFFYVMFVLGALHPGKTPADEAQVKLAGILIFAYLAVFIIAPPSLIGSTPSYSEIFARIPAGSTVLPVSVYFWEQPRWVLFKAFDFRLMSEFYLRRIPIRTYYSPMQQFYDTEQVWPDAQAFIQSVDSSDWETCIQARDRLSAKVDYLSIYAVSPIDDRHSWSYGLWSRLNNQSIMARCGVETTPALSTDAMENDLVSIRLKP